MKKEISPPMIIAIIAVAVLLIGIVGWKAMSGSHVVNGVDTSSAGVQPSDAYEGKNKPGR